LIHGFLMVLAWKQMSVAIHRDLQRGMTSKCLHNLWCHASFDPAGNREVPKPMPIKTLNWERIEQRQEMSLDQIIVSGMPRLEEPFALRLRSWESLRRHRRLLDG